MPFCCAGNCSNKPLKGKCKTFHLFPFSQPEICKKWITNVNGGKWPANQNSVVCSDHFEEDQFDLSGPTVKLKPCAIPTLFNPPKQDSSLTSDPSSTLKNSSVPTDDQSELSNVKITSVVSLAHPTQSGPQMLQLNNQSLSSPDINLPIPFDQIFGNNSSTVNASQQIADKSSPMIKKRKIFITAIKKLPEKPESSLVKDASPEPIRKVATSIITAPTRGSIPIRPAPARGSIPIRTTLIPIKLATTPIRSGLSLFKPASTLIRAAPISIKPAPIPFKPGTTLILSAPKLIQPATTPNKPASTPNSDPKSILRQIILEDHHYYTTPQNEVSISSIKPKQAIAQADVDPKCVKKLKPLQQKISRLEKKIISMDKTIDSLKTEQANSKDMFSKQASIVLTNLQRSAASSSKATSCTAVFIRSLY